MSKGTTRNNRTAQQNFNTRPKLKTLLIRKGTAKGKAWKIIYQDKGKKFTIQGGQKGKENVWSKEPNKRKFFQRHPTREKATTVKTYINAILWERGNLIGQRIIIDNKLNYLLNRYFYDRANKTNKTKPKF